MELKEFITGVIDEIFEAISEEQKKYYPDNKQLLPVIAPYSTPEAGTYQKHARKTDTIHFDLAITESKNVEKSIGGRAGISIVSIGGSSQKDSGNEIVQKVSFDITVSYPTVTGDKVNPSGQ